MVWYPRFLVNGFDIKSWKKKLTFKVRWTLWVLDDFWNQNHKIVIYPISYRCDKSSTVISWKNQKKSDIQVLTGFQLLTLNVLTEENDNVTFNGVASVSKGCAPIIELKFWSSMDVKFEENKNLDKCNIPVLGKFQPLGMIFDWNNNNS